MNKTKFEEIKNNNGHYASWAIWAEEGKKPKDNIGDLSIFDTKKSVNFLKKLNPNIILVGLNISRRVESPLSNFHDSRSQAMDYKIRYALKDSPYWGAYMTDIIKDFEQKASGKVMSYLRSDKNFEKENINLFQEELNVIGATNPKIIAFGVDAFKVLSRNFSNQYSIKKIPHYSNYTSKEEYREEVRCILNF